MRPPVSILRGVFFVVGFIMTLPVIFGIIYIDQGYWIPGILAIACAPAIVWVMIIGWKSLSFRLNLPILLYPGTEDREAASRAGASAYYMQDSEAQLPGQCRYCDTPLNLPSPICPKCGRKN